MIIRIPYTSILLTLCISTMLGQGSLQIGEWESHLPYQQGRSIAQSEDRVYFTTDYSVMYLDKEDFSPGFLSKVDGLHTVGTGLIRYDNTRKLLLVTYTDSHFDIIDQTGNITNYNNIDDDGNFFNRSINNVFIQPDGLWYFATGFGVIEFDPDSEDFRFTANLEKNVTSVVVFRNKLYASTEDGLYYASMNSGLNLSDVTNWNQAGIQNGFPVRFENNHLAVFGNHLWLDIDEVLHKYDGEDLVEISTEPDHYLRYLSAEHEHLLAGWYHNNNAQNGKMTIFNKDGQLIGSNGSSCVNRPYYAIEDQFGRIWYTDVWRGIRSADNFTASCGERLTYNSPYSIKTGQILIDERNGVFVSTVPAFSGDLTFDGLSSLKNGEWNIYNSLTVPFLQSTSARSFQNLAMHPVRNELYIGTYFSGLLIYNLDTDTWEQYRGGASPITFSSGANNDYRVSGLAMEDENKLWVVNHETAKPLLLFDTETKEWKTDFPLVSGSRSYKQLIVDDYGNKWIIVDGGSAGVCVFNEGNLEDPNDDQVVYFTQSNSELPTNEVRSLTKDLEGNIWIGTEDGALVFECGSGVFEDFCRGNRPIVEVGGFGAYLLEGEIVETIAVDGANRKWFGTQSGIFVQSTDGTEQIAYYNEDNSLLFDNHIFDIEIEAKTGRIFIATDLGLQSLQSDAIEADDFNSSDIYAYPNPVRPEYNGPIAIKGLARDANVKITDINGQLVYEGRALGGQAIWNGKDYTGRKAASGVYLVYSTSSRIQDNPDAAITKILFMH